MHTDFHRLIVLGAVAAISFVASPSKAAEQVNAQTIAQPGKANNPTTPPTQKQYPRERGNSRDAMLAIFQQGVAYDLAAPYQWHKLREYFGALTDGQIASISGLLNQCDSSVQQVLVLKSYIAGEPWPNLVQYAAEMRGLPEHEIIRRSTMRDSKDLIQQWQDACGPAMLQTVAGEADPRYAWELNKLGDITKIDPLGSNAVLAQQQKEWLEQYGGQAVLRGQTGRGIPITEFLNKALGPVVGASYVCHQSYSLDTTLDRVSTLLQNGYDVPLCIGWDESGTNNHFLVALAVRGNAGTRAFQVHDTWTGMTAWIEESNIRADRLSPVFTQFAKLTHYYEPIPTQ